jgi:CcmD family protein
MKKLLVIVSLLLSLQAAGQGEKYQITEEDYSNQKVEMADQMRANGKIYVVVGVIFIIFIGITFYLVRIDRKIATLEKEINNKEEV